jgi:hypothetical protein
MATDPVQRVRTDVFDLPVTFGMRETMSRLAAMPPSLDAPYLTVTLDWRPEGSDPGRESTPDIARSERRARRGESGASRRPSRGEMERQIEQLLAAYGPRGAAFDSLSADAARIAVYLDEELDPAAHGVYIAACAARELFEPLTFALPLATSVAAAPTPRITPLVRFADDHPVYAVLMADQHEAVLSIVRRASRGTSVRLESSGFPRRQQTGGLSQRNFRNRAEERIAAFARAIVEETQRAMDEGNIEQLIVAGNEVMTSVLAAEFPDALSARIVDTIRLDRSASEQEMLDLTLPIVERAERGRELASVRAIADAVGAADRGAAGAVDVLRALQNHQVSELALVDDFAGDGWADYGRETYGVGPIPDVHPLGGEHSDLVVIDLPEELIGLAVRSGAEIEIVHSAVSADAGEEPVVPRAGEPAPRSEAATLLDGLGSVGALLRFTIEPK